MMKMRWLAIMGVLWCGTSLAEEIALPHVTVFGTATRKVTPDRMVWYLTVRNKGGELPDVAEQHAKTVDEVLGFLKDHEVLEDELQTARMEFGENWVYKNKSRMKEGYSASTDIYFKIADFQTYTPLWFGLSKINHVSIDGVYYDHSKRIDIQNETRQKALIVAKEKAMALAATLGSQLGEPLLIEEDLSLENGDSRGRFSNVAYFDEPDLDESAGIAPGKIPIRIRVKAAFRLNTREN